MTKSVLHHPDLDLASRSIGKRTLARFPTWARYAHVKRAEGKEKSHLEFIIPCPNPVVEQDLMLSTEQHQLTLYFDTSHEHFENDDEWPTIDWIGDGLDLAAAILAEEVGCVTCHGRDRIYADFFAPLPLASPIDIPFKNTPVTRVTLRSWTGRFDRDEIRRPPSYFTSIARFFSMNFK